VSLRRKFEASGLLISRFSESFARKPRSKVPVALLKGKPGGASAFDQVTLWTSPAFQTVEAVGDVI